MSDRIPALAALIAGNILFLSGLSARADEAKGEKDADSGLQVVLDVKLMQVPEGFVDGLGITFDTIDAREFCGTVASSSFPPSAKKIINVAFLNEEQLGRLIEAAQQERRANITHRRVLTVENRRGATVHMTDPHFFQTDVKVEGAGNHVIIKPRNEPVMLGFHIKVSPLVSADRRFVQLALKMNQTEEIPSALALLPVKLSLPVDQTDGSKGKRKRFFEFFLAQPKFRKLMIEKTISIPSCTTVLFAGFKKPIDSGTATEETPSLLLVQAQIARRSGEMSDLAPSPTPKPVIQQATCISSVAPSRKQVSASCSGRQINIVHELLKAYDEACTAGRTDEAERLARAALILNPKCFQDRR